MVGRPSSLLDVSCACISVELASCQPIARCALYCSTRLRNALGHGDRHRKRDCEMTRVEISSKWLMSTVTAKKPLCQNWSKAGITKLGGQNDLKLAEPRGGAGSNQQGPFFIDRAKPYECTYPANAVSPQEWVDRRRFSGCRAHPHSLDVTELHRTNDSLIHCDHFDPSRSLGYLCPHYKQSRPRR